MTTATDLTATPRPYESRVDRNFAFIDLSGFTSFTDAQGDGAAVGVLTHFRTHVREIAAGRGVRIAKWLGDGAMLVGVETPPLMAAIADMQAAFEGAPLALRAGLSSGPVILFEGDDYIGQAVNLAARLCAKAGPGEILAPASMEFAMPATSQATRIGAHELKGFAAPVELIRLTRRDVSSA